MIPPTRRWMSRPAKRMPAASPLAVVHAWQMPAPRIEGSVALLASPIQVRAEHRSILRAAALEVSLTYPDLHIEQVLVQENAARRTPHPSR